MAIIDWLTGDSSLRKQRDANIRSAEQMYDPAVFNPMLDEQRQRAVEGIGQGRRDIARQRTIQQLFKPQDTSLYGGNQAAAIAGNQAQSRASQGALSQFESNLQSQDIQTQQQARQQFAQTQSQAMQTAGQRDATVDQIEGQYEAERSRRRQALGAGALQLAGTIATTPFGPAGATLAGKALGSVFGGDDSESVGMGQYLADVARAGVGVTDPSVRDNQFMNESFDQVSVPELDFNNTPMAQFSQQQATAQTQPVQQQNQNSQQPAPQNDYNFVEEMLNRQQGSGFDMTNPQIFPDDNLGYRNSQNSQPALTEEEMEQRLFDYEKEQAVGGTVDIVNRGFGLLSGYDFQGNRYPSSLADVGLEPFRQIGYGLQNVRQQNQEQRRRDIRELMKNY